MAGEGQHTLAVTPLTPPEAGRGRRLSAAEADEKRVVGKNTPMLLFFSAAENTCSVEKLHNTVSF